MTLDRILAFDALPSIVDPIVEVSNEMTMIISDEHNSSRRLTNVLGYSSPDAMNQPVPDAWHQAASRDSMPVKAPTRMMTVASVQSPHNYTVQSNDDREEGELADEGRDEKTLESFSSKEMRNRLDSFERELLDTNQQKQVANRESRALRQTNDVFRFNQRTMS